MEAALRTWARVWGRRPLVDGRSFREIFDWKGASLWWMTESFLRTAPESPACVRLVETWLRILEAEAPDEVEPVGLPARASVLLERAATSRGVLFHGRSRVPSSRSLVIRAWLRSFGPGATAAPPIRTSEASIHFLGDGISRLPLDLVRALRSKPARKEEARARRRFRRSFAELRRSPGVHEAFSHRGIPFYDLAQGDLALLLFVTLPRAVRLYEDMATLVQSARPRAAALLVPSRDERRTLLAACAAAQVPSVVLRTGEGEEPERADGGPQPQLVLAWNGSASHEDLHEALREAARLGVAADPADGVELARLEQGSGR
ncbi:MAG TPA: hypothetical protein VIC87_10700 [Vicinamibacteria bacterium]